MNIIVTQRDIDNGEHYFTRCPISLAIRKALGEHYLVSTFSNGTVIIWGSNSKSISLPEVAKEFIRAYDRREKEAIKPFTFQLKYDVAIIKVNYGVTK